MESISSSTPKGLRKYWRRRSRGYQRLINGSGWWRRKRRAEPVEQLGTAGRRRRWRLKISPKIRISRIPSPKKMLLWLRDAYVRMMLGLANTKAMTVSASATGYGGASMTVGGGWTSRPLKEYDEKMIVHIYKSLMMQAQGQLMPRDAPHKIAS